MADPVMYEGAVLSGLQSNISAATGDVLRSSILLTVVNAYDRKVLRDPFIDLMSNAVALSNNVGRIEVLEQIENMCLKSGTMSPRELLGVVSDAVKQVKEKAREQQKLVCMATEMVMQCPFSDDKVH